jgi:5-methylcytosine-specific restriction endonuclease McrA
MTEQPGYVLDEAMKLFAALRRRVRDDARAHDDVWGRATHDNAGSHFATGAPECQYCPVCRTVAAARVSGADVVGHVVDAGQSLIAAMRETVAAYDRSRPRHPGADGDPIDAG